MTKNPAKLLACIMAIVSLFTPGALMASEAEFMALYEPYLKKYKPLLAELESASWAARKVGSDEAFKMKKDARLALVALHSDAALFAKVASIQKSETIQDPLIARLASVMHDAFQPVQADREAVERIIEVETFLEQKLRNHRVTVDGKTMTTGEVRRILRATTDSQEAEKVWKAYMGLGKSLAPKVRELVQYRNRIAKKLEQPHYFRLQMHLNGFSKVPFYRFFNRLNNDMRDQYAETRKEIDTALAAKFGIAASELRPWHYGDLFFRDAPVTAVSDLDQLFKNVDLTDLARVYLDGIGLPCGDILKRSEFSTSPGATLFSYRVGFDPAGEVRVACHVAPTALGAENLFQALTKAVYRQSMSQDLPFLLRQPPHRSIDEGLGSFVGAMIRNPDFLAKVLKVDPKELQKLEETAKRTMRWRAFIRASWAQVLIRFELKMYGAPTSTYPNEWAEFFEEYQGITLPNGEYRYGFALVPEILFRSTTHYGTLMGDILAEQLNDYILKEVLGKDGQQRPCYAGEKKVGVFLRDKIMKPGNKYHWRELVSERAGGGFQKRFYLERSFGIEPSPDFKPRKLPVSGAKD